MDMQGCLLGMGTLTMGPNHIKSNQNGLHSKA